MLVLGQSFQSLAYAGIALFLPLIRTDLGLTFSQAGLLAAVSTLVYAAMQLPAGALADRADPKLVFTVGLVGTNVTAILFAGVRAYALLLLIQAASGFFRALIFTPGLTLIRDQFPPDRSATAMGLFVAGGFSSNIVLNLLGPVLVGPLGWPTLFVLFGASGVLCGVLYYRYGAPPRPRPASPGSAAGSLRALLGEPVMWLTGVIQFVRLAVVYGSTFWLPTYVVERGFPLSTAGAVVALGAALTAPSNLAGGWIADRLDRPLAVVGVSLVVLAGTLVALPLISGLGLVIAVVAVQSVFIQIYFGPLFALPLRHLDPSVAGMASGFGNFWANVGGFAFTYALGALRDATGSFVVGFWSLAALTAVALAATAALARRPAPARR